MRRLVVNTMAAIYGGPGLYFLFQGEWFGALWGLGFGLYMLSLADLQ